MGVERLPGIPAVTYEGVLAARARDAHVSSRPLLERELERVATIGASTNVRERPPAMERFDASAAIRCRSPEAPAMPGREKASE